jgi:hypothetical protein
MAHGDYTGQSKARLAQQYAEEVALAAKSKTLVTQVVQEGRDEVIDLFNDKDYENLHTQTAVGPNGQVEVHEVDVVDPQYQPVKFRASEDLDQVTVGQGREFNLQAGRTYQSPRWVAEHLDNQGLVWH